MAKITKHASGGYSVRYASGYTEEVTPSGTTRKTSPSGHVEEDTPSGAYYSHSASGSVTKKSSRGSYHSSPWGRADEDDSTVYDETSSTEKIKEYIEEIKEEKSQKPRYQITETLLSNNYKHSLLSNHHKTIGENDEKYFCYVDQSTGEENWYKCAHHILVSSLDTKKDITEKYVSARLSLKQNQIVNEVAVLNTNTHNSTDIVILLQVDKDEKGNWVTNNNQYFVAHATTHDIVPLSVFDKAHIEDDAETFKIQNRAALGTHYDEYSTRTNTKVGHFVSAPKI